MPDSHTLRAPWFRPVLASASTGPVLAALTSLGRRHGEAAAVLPTARLDAPTLVEATAGVEDTGLLFAPVLSGELGACPVHDPRLVVPLRLLLPVVDARSSCVVREASGVRTPVPLAALSDAQLECTARQLGWLPRLTRRDPRALREALAWARHEIRVLQATAREGIVPSRVAWPLVLVRPEPTSGAASRGRRRGGES